MITMNFPKESLNSGSMECKIVRDDTTCLCYYGDSSVMSTWSLELLER